jgi:hypothetical protein
VPELIATPAAVIACMARPDALDGLYDVIGCGGAVDALAAAHACRVAGDELLLVAPLGARAEVHARVRARLAGLDAAALVIDQTDGWAAFTLAGPDARRLFSRLSALPLPAAAPRFVQGAVAQLPAKVLVLADALHVLVPAPAAHHFATRALEAGRALGVRLRAAAELPVLPEAGTAVPAARAS